jgi:hypothetical protein
MNMIKIADRNISMEFFLTEKGELIAHGVLTDDRAVAFRAFKGDNTESGRFHTLHAEMTLSLPELVIGDITVRFEDVPEESCADIAAVYRDLIGVRVVSGYTSAVLNIAGGVKGCSHLTHLLVVMGPAIVQGAFTALAAVDSSGELLLPDGVSRDQMESYFYNSCHVWKK